MYALGTATLQSTPNDVDLVMVNGKILKRDGRLVGVDKESLRARTRDDSRRTMEKVKRSREALVMQKGGDLVSILEKVQRTCFAGDNT